MGTDRRRWLAVVLSVLGCGDPAPSGNPDLKVPVVPPGGKSTKAAAVKGVPKKK